MELSPCKGRGSVGMDTFKRELDRFLDVLEIEGEGDIGSCVDG